MSFEARAELIGRLVLRNPSQRTDLLDPEKTQTNLIALLLDVTRRVNLEITAVRSDHLDDSEKGPHGHAHGFAVDCWPLRSTTEGDYLSNTDPLFLEFLRACCNSEYLHQIGLAGSADTSVCQAAAGPTCFSDMGADHIHLGAH